MLAALVVDAGRFVPVDTLVNRVWGAQPPQQVRRTLHTYLTRIRRLLEQAGAEDDHRIRVVRRAGGYLLEAEPSTVDMHMFHTLVGRARIPGRGAEEQASLLTEALALWRGDPLAGLPGEWAARVRAGCRQQHLDAVAAWADAQLRLGRPDLAIDPLTELVAEHPLAEPTVAALMRALFAAGRAADALACYGVTRRRLAEELGIDAGPELRRLHQAIVRGGLDQRSSAHPGARPAAQALPLQSPSPPLDRAPTVPAQLPPDVHGFTGRDVELARLDAILAAAREQPTAVVIAALSGTAGVGKTALAVHWAHRVRDRFRDGQLYINLRGFDGTNAPLSHGEALRRVLQAFEVPPQRIPATVADKIDLYRSILAERRVLVVLDNARDANQVRPLLPGSPGSLILVTSRNPLPDLVAAEGAYQLIVDLLTENGARQLILRRLGASRVAAEPAAVDRIIARCARLPLALSIVVARAAIHPHFALTALAEELRAARGSLDAFAGLDGTADVRAVLSWSYRTLSPSAARLFRLLGLHPAPDIAAPAVASCAGVPRSRACQLLAEIAQAQLMTEHLPGRYMFHDLLRAYATELTQLHDRGPERREAIERMLDHYLHVAQLADRLLNPHLSSIALDSGQPGVSCVDLADQQSALAWLNGEHVALVAAVDLAADVGLYAHAWRLACVTAAFFSRQGHWQDQMATQRTALRAAQQIADPAGEAHAHRNLGRAYAMVGDVSAHPHLLHALELFTTLDDKVSQAMTHRNLAWMFEQNGNDRQSLHHNERALELFRAVGHRPGEARALNAVGWNHARLGDHRSTLNYCQPAVALLNEAGDHHGEAVTWDSLGYAHHHLGDHEQAIECFHRSLALLTKGGDLYNEAEVLRHLGDTLLSAGDPDSARSAWRRTLEILDHLGHPDAEQVRAILGSPREILTAQD